MNKILIAIFFLLLVSCVLEPTPDDRLLIINRSGKVICFDYEVDTVLHVPSINKKEFFIRERLDPGDSTRVEKVNNKDQWVWDVSHGKDSTLSIFIFDYEQVLKTDWDTLRANGRYKRLDYKLSDLNKNNWTVIVK
ncbi:MAG: hypothetical protein HOP08_04830 [Cyclobacteriaceae bacterium]|nr:hypothetical protein [Cyclobacteriaceae bacterium]